jgi:hypothetical protein
MTQCRAAFIMENGKLFELQVSEMADVTPSIFEKKCQK